MILSFCSVCCRLLQCVAAELRDMCAVMEKVCCCFLQCVLHVDAACCSRTAGHVCYHEEDMLLCFAVVCVACCCSVLQPNFETYALS